MIEKRIGPWRLVCDPRLTSELYAAMDTGAAEKCGCMGCENYRKGREFHMEQPFAALLRELGVDPLKELSVRRVAPLDKNTSLYAGSFAVAGRLAEGPDARGKDGVRIDVFEEVTKRIYVAFRTWTAPPPGWRDVDCVRLRFLLIADWLGPEADAPVDLSICKGPADRTW